MGDEGEVSKPGVSERCATCKKRIRGEDRDELIQNYTDHQVEVHDKPRSVHGG